MAVEGILLPEQGYIWCLFLLLLASRYCYFFCFLLAFPKEMGRWSSGRDIYLLQTCPIFVFSVNKPLDCTSLSDTYFCWLLYKLPVLYSTSASLLLICCSWHYRCSLWSGVLFLPLLFLVKEHILSIPKWLYSCLFAIMCLQVWLETPFQVFQTSSTLLKHFYCQCYFLFSCLNTGKRVGCSWLSA